MITLKMNMYSNEEKRKLAELIDTAVVTVTPKNSTCKETHCRTCEFKHVCDDLCRALKFLNQELRQKK